MLPCSEGGNSRPSVSSIPDTPTVSDFSVTGRKEMAPQWLRQHRNSVDATFDSHLLAEFGERPVGSITKADVLAFRARLAELPGRSGPQLTPTTINRLMGLLRQCLTEASERFSTQDAFQGVQRLRGRGPAVRPLSLAGVGKNRTTHRPAYRHYANLPF